MSCILHARYTMVADVYAQTTIRDESGQIQRYWAFDREIDLIARSIMGGGIRVVGSMERWSEEYLPIDWIKFQTDARLNKRHRIHNIRDKSSGTTLWYQNESTDATNVAPMMFDIVGVNPVVSPFGDLMEYDSLAKKVQNLEESDITWR